MGNPETLRHPPGGPPVEPPKNRVLWTVYQLRQYGEKLPRDLVLRTGKTGTLEMLPMGAGLRARLLHPFTDEALDSMWDAKVVRMDERGMLLHGAALNGDPQAWWCLVASIERARVS